MIDNNVKKNSLKIVGIRRENKNKWERRVALTPDAIRYLVSQGIKVIFQSCTLRCYTNKQYLDAGAEMEENIDKADIIFGVKEIPLDFLLANKTFLFFSHTFKGQSGNMPALKEMLDKKIRLIDYELIKENPEKNPAPQRLVAFGRYAGVVGAIDFLQGLGDFLMYKKTYTPFLHTGYSYMYPNLDFAKARITKVGNLIKQKKINKNLLPLVFAVTGNGRVSKGSIEILELLPHKWIEPDELQSLFDQDSNTINKNNNFVYLTKIEHKHMYYHKDNKEPSFKNFNKEHFYANKREYKSLFAEKYLPFISALFHCMYWDTDSPVIISDEDARLRSEEGRLRLLGITDITCDVPISSIELLKKTTTIESPFYSIDPKTGAIEYDFQKMSNDSILYHAVDHLPSELPFDSSNHFSEKLTPFVKDIMNSDYPSDYCEKSLPPEIHNACETWNGKLCPKYDYLYGELAKHYNQYKKMTK